MNERTGEIWPYFQKLRQRVFLCLLMVNLVVIGHWVNGRYHSLLEIALGGEVEKPLSWAEIACLHSLDKLLYIVGQLI
jgi:hypothetical protein